MAVTNTATRIQILNAALVRLGERTVVGFEESGPATALYPEVRLAFLERFTWSFATYRQRLAKFVAPPESDFANQFSLPAEPAFIRAIDNDDTIPPVVYSIENMWNPATESVRRALLSDADEVVLAYIGDTDESLWSPLARQALSKRLAAEMSTHITSKQNLRQTLLVEAEAAYSEAVVSDQAGDTPKRAQIDSRYLIARRAAAGYDPDQTRGNVTLDDLIV